MGQQDEQLRETQQRTEVENSFAAGQAFVEGVSKGWEIRALKAEAERDAAPARVEKLEAALIDILDNAGDVCDAYETCDHLGCESTIRASGIAQAALAPTEVENARQEGETDQQRAARVRAQINDVLELANSVTREREGRIIAEAERDAAKARVEKLKNLALRFLGMNWSNPMFREELLAALAPEEPGDVSDHGEVLPASLNPSGFPAGHCVGCGFAHDKDYVDCVWKKEI